MREIIWLLLPSTGPLQGLLVRNNEVAHDGQHIAHLLSLKRPFCHQQSDVIDSLRSQNQLNPPIEFAAHLVNA